MITKYEETINLIYKAHLDIISNPKRSGDLCRFFLGFGYVIEYNRSFNLKYNIRSMPIMISEQVYKPYTNHPESYGWDGEPVKNHRHDTSPMGYYIDADITQMYNTISWNINDINQIPLIIPSNLFQDYLDFLGYIKLKGE